VVNHPSQVWCSILDDRDALKIHLIKRIGDGRSTNAWNTNWLPIDARLRHVAPRTEDPPLMVCDYTNQAMAEWNVQKLEEHFHPADVNFF
jgi:hypothetical protein